MLIEADLPQTIFNPGVSFLNRPKEEIPSICASVRRTPLLFLQSRFYQSSGFSLLELMMTVALISVLMALMIPCWGAITRSRSRQAGTTLVMETLELARTAAITGKTDVWVVFRNEGGSSHGSLRILSRQGTRIQPLGPWQKLPAGISFLGGVDSFMKEKPPGEVLSSSLGTQVRTNDEDFGSVMFQRSGGIGMPLPGSNALQLELANNPDTNACSTITLSRATGRAGCQ